MTREQIEADARTFWEQVVIAGVSCGGSAADLAEHASELLTEWRKRFDPALPPFEHPAANAAEQERGEGVSRGAFLNGVMNARLDSMRAEREWCANIAVAVAEHISGKWDSATAYEIEKRIRGGK